MNKCPYCNKIIGGNKGNLKTHIKSNHKGQEVRKRGRPAGITFPNGYRKKNKIINSELNNKKFNIDEFENEIDIEFNYLEQLKGVAKQVFRLMKVEKLEKFSIGAGEMAREIMIKTQKYLNKELNGSIKKNRRIIDYESEC